MIVILITIDMKIDYIINIYIKVDAFQLQQSCIFDWSNNNLNGSISIKIINIFCILMRSFKRPRHIGQMCMVRRPLLIFFKKNRASILKMIRSIIWWDISLSICFIFLLQIHLPDADDIIIDLITVLDNAW